MKHLKSKNLKKIGLVSILVLICIACYSANQDNKALSQVPQQNQSGSPKHRSDDERVIGKAYIDVSGNEKITEFRTLIDEDGKETLSVYLDQQKKVSLKDTANPSILADFNDQIYGRVFVLAVASPASGNCGNSSFAIVTVGGETNDVKISKPSKIKCQGEIQDIKIETRKNKEVFRLIIINKLKFDLEKFEWAI